MFQIKEREEVEERTNTRGKGRNEGIKLWRKRLGYVFHYFFTSNGCLNTHTNCYFSATFNFPTCLTKSQITFLKVKVKHDRIKLILFIDSDLYTLAIFNITSVFFFHKYKDYIKCRTVENLTVFYISLCIFVDCMRIHTFM